MELSILFLEIGLRPESIGLPVWHSTPDRLGLDSRVRAHLKEEELFYPVTEKVFNFQFRFLVIWSKIFD